MTFWADNDGAFELLMRVHDQHKAIEPHKWTRMAGFLINVFRERPYDLLDEELDTLVEGAHAGLLTYCNGVQRVKLRSELYLAPGLMLALRLRDLGWDQQKPCKTRALARACCALAFYDSVDWLYLALTDILVAYKVSREAIITIFPSTP